MNDFIFWKIAQNVVQAMITQLLQIGGIGQSSKKMMEADPDFLMGKVFLLVSEIVSLTYMSQTLHWHVLICIDYHWAVWGNLLKPGAEEKGVWAEEKFREDEDFKLVSGMKKSFESK